MMLAGLLHPPPALVTMTTPSLIDCKYCEYIFFLPPTLLISCKSQPIIVAQINVLLAAPNFHLAI